MLKTGDNFTCPCKGEGGSPPVNVTWYKGGVKFTDVGTEKQTLNLSNVSEVDSGTYMCVATSHPHENYTDEKYIQVMVHCKFDYRPSMDCTVKNFEFPFTERAK